MLLSLSLGLALVVIGQAVESSNPKKSRTPEAHVAVDADGEVHHVTARAQHPFEQKTAEQNPSKTAKGFHVRSSGVDSPKIAKSSRVKEHKVSTVRADPTDAPPTDAPPADAPPTDAPPADAPPTDAPPADAPPTDASTAAPETSPSPDPAQKSSGSPDQSDPAQKSSSSPDQSKDAPASPTAAPVSASAAPDSKGVAAKVFVGISLVAAFFLIGWIMRERILELPYIKEMVIAVRLHTGIDEPIRQSRPQGPRKKMQIERSESSQEYSSMRQAAYADQSEYLSPVQTDNDTSSTSDENGEAPAGKA